MLSILLGTLFTSSVADLTATHLSAPTPLRCGLPDSPVCVGYHSCPPTFLSCLPCVCLRAYPVPAPDGELCEGRATSVLSSVSPGQHLVHT